MEGFWERMKSGVSYEAFVRASYNFPTPQNLLLHQLDKTHKGQVLQDGIREGVATLGGETIGFLGHVGRFIVGHTTGIELEEVSGDWITEEIRGAQEREMRILGQERPKRNGLGENALHLTGQLIPAIATLAIPGGQEAGAVKATSILGKIGNSLKSFATAPVNMSFVAEYGMQGVEYGEEKLDVHPNLASLVIPDAVASVFKPPQTDNADNPASSRTWVGKIGSPSPAHTPTQKESASLTPVQTAKFLDMALGNDNAQFDADQATQLQTLLADAGQYDRKKIDGIVGDKTMTGVDRLVRSSIRQAPLDDETKAAFKDRMTELTKELRDNPASPYSYDPRVVALQTCGYALGLYNKKIDGLTGPATENAMAFVENKSLENMAKMGTPDASPVPAAKPLMAPV